MLDKKTEQILRNQIKKKKSEQGFKSGKSMIKPKSDIEAIKKRLCLKIINLKTNHQNKSLNVIDFAKKYGLSKASMTSILKYNLGNVSIDSAIGVLSIASESEDDVESREALIRIAIC
jgi:replication initiation and membrane attachment protein DnaB